MATLNVTVQYSIWDNITNDTIFPPQSNLVDTQRSCKYLNDIEHAKNGVRPYSVVKVETIVSTL